jgi:hypothetical protein
MPIGWGSLIENYLRPMAGYFDSLKNNLMKGLSSLKEINSNNFLTCIKQICIFLIALFLIDVLFVFQAYAYTSDIHNAVKEFLITIGGLLVIIFMIYSWSTFFWKLKTMDASMEKDQVNFLSQLISALKNNKHAINKIISNMKKRVRRKYTIHYVPSHHHWCTILPQLEDIIKINSLTTNEKIAILKEINRKKINIYDAIDKDEIHKIYKRIIESKTERFMTQLISAFEKDDNRAIEMIINKLKLMARDVDIFTLLGSTLYGKLAPALEELLRSKELSNNEKIKCLKMISEKNIKFLGVPNPLIGWRKIRKIFNSSTPSFKEKGTKKRQEKGTVTIFL